MSFSKNLKQLRAEKKISQADFAQKIGVHVTHLSRYERGLSSPSLEVTQKIAEELDISIDILVFGHQNNVDSINDKELASLFKKVEFLSEKEKEMIKSFLSAFVLKADLTQKLAK
jgi:transcriptional regulator with XRE-family HTH domain